MNKKLIAVMDEDSAFLRLLDRVLASQGYRSLLLSEHDDLAAVLRWQCPDLLILGVGLVLEPARSLLDQARLDRRVQSIPVIVCSADLQFLQGHAGEFKEVGWDSLGKPFDLDDLLSKIDLGLRREWDHMPHAA